MAESRPSVSTSSETEITLGVLSAIQESSEVTQRSVARELGIALGLANAYLKRCVKKGLIKVAQVPSNRYAYYLTPVGFSEKSKLTAEYLSQSFHFFRQARSQCEALFARCAERGWRRVVLAGASDLGEIATLCAREHNIEVIGFLEAGSNRENFAGLPVLPDPASLKDADVVIVTDLGDPQGVFEALRARMPAGRVLHPKLLRIVDDDPPEAPAAMSTER